MAGAFGYAADTIDVSLAMGELSLLPAVRQAPDDAIIVAEAASCRHQIHDGAGRDAVHVARVLAQAMVSETFVKISIGLILRSIAKRCVLEGRAAIRLVGGWWLSLRKSADRLACHRDAQLLLRSSG